MTAASRGATQRRRKSQVAEVTAVDLGHSPRCSRAATRIGKIAEYAIRPIFKPRFRCSNPSRQSAFVRLSCIDPNWLSQCARFSHLYLGKRRQCGSIHFDQSPGTRGSRCLRPDGKLASPLQSAQRLDESTSLASLSPSSTDLRIIACARFDPFALVCDLSQPERGRFDAGQIGRKSGLSGVLHYV